MVLGELEVGGTGIGGEAEQDYPLSLVCQKWFHAVAAHVRRDGDSVGLEVVEHGLGVHAGGVADVTALAVDDEELVGVALLDVAAGVAELFPALGAAAFVEGAVGLVGHAVRRGGVDDGAVEGDDGIVATSQAAGKFCSVGVEAHAEE